MKRLTQYKFKLELPLSRKEVFNIISQNTEYASKNVILPKHFTISDKKFTGKVNGISFALAPIISYGNGWLPLIVGEINESKSGTIINIQTVTHKMQTGIIISFDLICLLFIAVGLFILLFDNILLKDFLIIILMPTIFMIFNRLLLFITACKTVNTFKKMF